MPPRRADASCLHVERIYSGPLLNGIGPGSQCPCRHPNSQQVWEFDTQSQQSSSELSQRVYPRSRVFEVTLDARSTGGSEDSNRELRSVSSSYVDGTWSRGTKGCEGEQVACAESDGVGACGAGNGDSYPGKVIREESGGVQWRVDTGTNISGAHPIPIAISKHPEADARGSLLETHRNVCRPHHGLGTRRCHARGEMACCGSGSNPVDGRERLWHRSRRQDRGERHDEQEIHEGKTTVGSQGP